MEWMGKVCLQFSFMLAQTHASRGDVWEALDDLYSNAKLDQGPKCRPITIDFLSTGSDRRTDSDIGVVIFGHHCR